MEVSKSNEKKNKNLESAYKVLYIRKDVEMWVKSQLRVEWCYAELKLAKPKQHNQCQKEYEEDTYWPIISNTLTEFH